MFLKTRSMCAGRLAGFVPLLIVLSSAASSTPTQAAEAQAGGGFNFFLRDETFRYTD